MDLIDIRFQIAINLRYYDLINFLSIDKKSFSLNNDYLWETIAKNINIINNKNLKKKIKFYNDTQDQVDMIIYKTLKHEKVNIINIVSSFTYLNKVMLKTHLLSHYDCDEDNKLSSIIKYYELDSKYLKELYIYINDNTFNMEFNVPKIYNISLQSYTWYGITMEEIKLFLFYFIYHHVEI